MKITCGVEISLTNPSSLYSGSKQKYSVATLALCCQTQGESKSDKHALLIVCTPQNPNGMKYKIYSNVEKLFRTFINDGKATVRFKEPAHDLIISKAEPHALKAFLRGIELIVVGQGTGNINFSSRPTKVNRPKKKLSVTKRSDYPSIKAGFPGSLVQLQIQSCSIAKIDQRILKLQYLQTLDLSNNSIKELPLALSEMNLKELLLIHNEISHFPAQLSKGNLGQSLKVLDLSFNQLTGLSPYFCIMKNLLILSLGNNKLKRCPRNMHCLKSLKKLIISNNELKTIPYGITKLHLETLDLCNNPMDTNMILQSTIPLEVSSLQESAASVIVKHKIYCTEEDVSLDLMRYIIGHCHCLCGKIVFHNMSPGIIIMPLQSLASTVVYAEFYSNLNVPLEAYFCSSLCWKRFHGFIPTKRKMNSC